MVKAKAKATVMVADGAGGMTKLEDRRFEKGEWPIGFEVPNDQEQADRWRRYIRAECHRRGWSEGSLGQIERAENSGTVTISAPGKPILAVVWERRRGRSIKARARILSSELSLAEAQQFFDAVNERCRSGATERIYVRGTLQYCGMAWRGALWLDDRVRLGPPSLQDEPGTYVNGAGVVHVDAMLDCIGETDVAYARHQILVELSAFLTVVLGTHVRLPDNGRAWAWTADASGCEVRQLGYMEARNPTSMPVRGSDRALPLHPVDRPPLNYGSLIEQSVRDDVVDLWRAYRSLTVERRRQFLQVAAKWQEAVWHWQERASFSYTLMVVACEALGPSDVGGYNCYHVVEALLGRPSADRLRRHTPSAQTGRNIHLHTGGFLGPELLREMDFMSTYQDPSFRDAHRELFTITQDAIIEWLKRGGAFTMPKLKQKKSWRRWVKEHALTIIPIIMALCLIVGLVVGLAIGGS
jgi:hypothetical protein